MYKYEDQKEMRRAMNGKMIVMMVGVLMIITAITSTVRMAVSCFGIAGQAAEGVKKYVELLKEYGQTIGNLRLIGGIYGFEAVAEIFAGVFSVRLSNRLDTSRLCMGIALGLLGLEVIVQGFLIFTGFAMPSMIFSALVMPLMLLWGVSSLRKLAKKYPDRKYAMEPNPARKKAAQPQKKNLMERAKVQTADVEKASHATGETSEANVTKKSMDVAETSEESTENVEDTAERNE